MVKRAKKIKTDNTAAERNRRLRARKKLELQGLQSFFNTIVEHIYADETEENLGKLCKKLAIENEYLIPKDLIKPEPEPEKTCVMNCGPHADYPQSLEEIKSNCDDCES